MPKRYIISRSPLSLVDNFIFNENSFFIYEENEFYPYHMGATIDDLIKINIFHNNMHIMKLLMKFKKVLDRETKIDNLLTII